jgi:hypothetical protein
VKTSNDSVEKRQQRGKEPENDEKKNLVVLHSATNPADLTAGYLQDRMAVMFQSYLFYDLLKDPKSLSGLRVQLD